MDTATNSTTEETTDLLAIGAGVKLTPALLFVPSGLDVVIERVRAKAEAHVPDISTEKGRKAIASNARRVSSSKTYIDDLGKALTSDIDAQRAVILAERKRGRDTFDEIRDKVRKPLTDWEDKEKERISEHERELAELAAFTAIPLGGSPTQIEAHIAAVEAFASRDWQEFEARYIAQRDADLAWLGVALADARLKEVERAELVRLRVAEELRKTAEREERIRTEAAEKAETTAKAEAQRAADALASSVRREQEAAARAQRESDERAEAAERAAKKAILDAEQATQRERERVAEAERTEAKALATREANTQHRGRINREIVAVLKTNFEITEGQAKALVTAIAKGEIPHVQVNY